MGDSVKFILFDENLFILKKLECIDELISRMIMHDSFKTYDLFFAHSSFILQECKNYWIAETE